MAVYHKQLQQDYQKIELQNKDNFYNFELINFLELAGMLDLAEIIVQGALARQESRGSHYRIDFKQRDDINWLRHSLAYFTPEGVTLKYQEVNLSLYAPQERNY